MIFIKTNVALFQFKQTFYFDNYRVLLILILVLIVIGIIIFFSVNIFNNRFWTITQMHSIYECGFLPFEEARVRFEPKFYMVALSFTIFDLEICFIFPWLLIYNHISMLCFLLFFLFLLLILVGIFYEWKMGIFDWSTV
jgi:NADH:ubiquinone oxidoreductase subunit 3 (subunit A)